MATPKNPVSFVEDGQPPVVNCLQSFLNKSAVVVKVVIADVDVLGRRVVEVDVDVVLNAVGASIGVTVPLLSGPKHMVLPSCQYQQLYWSGQQAGGEPSTQQVEYPSYQPQQCTPSSHNSASGLTLEQLSEALT